MNEWWDKDEDKAIASVVAGLIILIGIAVLNKAVLFIIALFLVSDRVLHRCNLWTTLEGHLCEVGETVSSDMPEFDDSVVTKVKDDEDSVKE